MRTTPLSPEKRAEIALWLSKGHKPLEVALAAQVSISSVERIRRGMARTPEEGK